MEFQSYLVNYFNLKLLHSCDDIKDIYNIRKSKNSDEFHFIEPEAYSKEHNIDYFDQYSTHLLIEHKNTHLLSSCIRIVPAVIDGQSRNLPIETHYYNELDSLARQDLKQSREKLCEISRLAINAHRTEQNSLITQNKYLTLEKSEYTKLQTLAISTFLAASIVALEYGFSRAYLMMEPFLVRRLSLLDIPLLQVGNEVDFQGLRAPYLVEFESIEKHTKSRLATLYRAIENCIGMAHQPYYCVMDR